MSAHQYFDDGCNLGRHATGDRHRNLGGLDQEWTGQVWAPVCPRDDAVMSGRDAAGQLLCTVCGRTHGEIVEAAR